MNAQLPPLRDIHLPADPSWWPPAPLWWLLAGILLVLLVVAALRLRQAWLRWRWRRTWLHELDLIAGHHARHGEHARTAAAVSQLLRRATLVIDAQAAALPGERWLEFLGSRSAGGEFAGSVGRTLLGAPWQAHADGGAEELIAAARHWLTTAMKDAARHV